MRKLKFLFLHLFTLLKKVFVNLKLLRLNKIAQHHTKSFNYHFSILENTTDDFLKSKHKQLLIKHLINLETINKRISVLEPS